MRGQVAPYTRQSSGPKPTTRSPTRSRKEYFPGARENLSARRSRGLRLEGAHAGFQLTTQRRRGLVAERTVEHVRRARPPAAGRVRDAEVEQDLGLLRREAIGALERGLR